VVTSGLLGMSFAKDYENQFNNERKAEGYT